jgi:hypothetical protein
MRLVLPETDALRVAMCSLPGGASIYRKPRIPQARMQLTQLHTLADIRFTSIFRGYASAMLTFFHLPAEALSTNLFLTGKMRTLQEVSVRAFYLVETVEALQSDVRVPTGSVAAPIGAVRDDDYVDFLTHALAE